MINFSIVLLHC